MSAMPFSGEFFIKYYFNFIINIRKRIGMNFYSQALAFFFKGGGGG